MLRILIKHDFFSHPGRAQPLSYIRMIKFKVNRELSNFKPFQNNFAEIYQLIYLFHISGLLNRFWSRKEIPRQTR